MKRALRLFVVLLLLALVRCGGGSEGTGVGTKSIVGTIKLTDGSPFAGAEITILETGDSSLSDASGAFRIDTQTDATALSLSVEKGDISARTAIEGLDPTASNIMIALTLDPRGDASLVTVGYLDIFARIVGNCEKYFSNERVIKQRRAVPEDLVCTLRFFASGDGLRLERIRGRIEVRTCNAGDEWRPLKEGLTGTGSTAGFGDIDFDFIDDRRNCVYRLIAPINDPQGRQIDIRIQTRTFQNSREGSALEPE